MGFPMVGQPVEKTQMATGTEGVKSAIYCEYPAPPAPQAARAAAGEHRSGIYTGINAGIYAGIYGSRPRYLRRCPTLPFVSRKLCNGHSQPGWHPVLRGLNEETPIMRMPC